jgi:hypothetical protein
MTKEDILCATSGIRKGLNEKRPCRLSRGFKLRLFIFYIRDGTLGFNESSILCP